jgi:hypothetical protein
VIATFLQSNLRVLSKTIITILFGIIFFVSVKINCQERYLNSAGLVRICQIVDKETFDDAFFSRSLFTQISYYILKEQPFFGIGFERYRDYVVPVSLSLNAGTGTWSDSSNNFYLQILIEFGVLAAILLFLILSSLRNSLVVDKRNSTLVITLLILLVFGSHISFSEVALLFGLIFASTFISLPNTKPLYLILAVAIGTTNFLIGIRSENGLYAWEEDEHGYYQWSVGRGSLSVNCFLDTNLANAFAKLSFTSPALPYRLGQPEVKIQGGTYFKQLDFSAGRTLEIKVPCHEYSQDNQKINLQFSILREWTPRSIGLGKDTRVLGVQVRRDKGF